MRNQPENQEQAIRASADQLIAEYGEAAWFVASQRADAALAAGEMDERRIHLRILARIRELEGANPTGVFH